MIIIFHPQGQSELGSEEQYEDGEIINLASLFSQPGQFSLIEDEPPGGIADLEISPADLATLESMTTTKPTVR